jgi:hypothetical protein
VPVFKKLPDGTLLVWSQIQNDLNNDIDMLLDAITKIPHLIVRQKVINAITKCKNDFWCDKEAVLEWAKQKEISKVYFDDEASQKLHEFKDVERIRKQLEKDVPVKNVLQVFEGNVVDMKRQKTGGVT